MLPNHEEYYPKKISSEQYIPLWRNGNSRYRILENLWDSLQTKTESQIKNQLGEGLQNIDKKYFDNADLVYEISPPSFILYSYNSKTNYLNDFLGIKKRFLLIWFEKRKNKLELREFLKSEINKITK